MAIGIVTNQDFNSEMERLGIKPVDDSAKSELDKSESEVRAPGAVITIPNKGRGNTNQLPSSLRAVIAEEAISGTSSKEIQKAFGVSQSSISAYRKGATSTATIANPNESLLEHTNRIRSRISSKASSRILAALNQLTPEKIADSKAREIAGIAKDMSAVVRNLEGEQNTVDRSNKVIIYAPRVREESEFEVIQVNT